MVKPTATSARRQGMDIAYSKPTDQPMKSTYYYFLFVAVASTLVLFALDSDPYIFTLPSIIGYIVVGFMYTMCIYLALSVPYYFIRLLMRMVRK
jgi:hypothetical protein